MDPVTVQILRNKVSSLVDEMHYDFYRLENINELAELNIFENIKNNISIIEWPKKLIKYKDIENYYLIKIKILNSFMRAIEISNSNKKIF